MENLGTVFPSLIVGESRPNTYYVTAVIQFMAFIVFFVFVIKVIKIYFKNLELKNEPEKNAEEIQANLDKMSKTIKILIKVAGIAFFVIIFSQIILGNFYE